MRGDKITFPLFGFDNLFQFDKLYSQWPSGSVPSKNENIGAESNVKSRQSKSLAAFRIISNISRFTEPYFFINLFESNDLICPSKAALSISLVNRK